MSTSPPLMRVDLTLPDWPHVARARRRLDAVRSGTGLLATAAGALSAAAGLFIGDLTGISLVTDAVLSLGGLVTLRLGAPDGHQKATASVLYLIPGVSLAALLVAERAASGTQWWEALGLAVWTVGVGVARPARVARLMMSPPPPAPVADPAPAQDEVAVDAHPAAVWWAQHVAQPGGAAPGTVLEDVERTGEASMRAIIRSVVPGEPVPDIPIRRLSALTDVPEGLITVGTVPGRGAGVRLLTIGQAAEDELDPAVVWAQRIAPAAMPGSALVGIRVGRPGAASEGGRS